MFGVELEVNHDTAASDVRCDVLRVLLADDNVLVREGVRALLTARPGLDVVAVAEDYDGLVAAADGHAPDVIVTDMVFCIAFGLSMDYEVFLVSRIKEEYDANGGDNTAAVANGLQRTGRIMTAAAGVLSITFIAFALTSHVTTIKLFGLAMTLAIVLDATLVRGLLVPSFLRLGGDANWWAPAPLHRIHERFGLSESDTRTERG